MPTQEEAYGPNTGTGTHNKGEHGSMKNKTVSSGPQQSADGQFGQVPKGKSGQPRGKPGPKIPGGSDAPQSPVG